MPTISSLNSMASSARTVLGCGGANQTVVINQKFLISFSPGRRSVASIAQKRCHSKDMISEAARIRYIAPRIKSCWHRGYSHGGTSYCSITPVELYKMPQTSHQSITLDCSVLISRIDMPLGTHDAKTITLDWFGTQKNDPSKTPV